MNITLTTSHSLFLPFHINLFHRHRQRRSDILISRHLNVRKRKERDGWETITLAGKPSAMPATLPFPVLEFQTLGVRHNARDNESCHRSCKNQTWNGSSQPRSRKSPVPTVQQRLYLFQAVNAIAVFKN